VAEVLCNFFDFLWIDMEHNPLTLEAVQNHILAAKGSNTTPLVRVPCNDPSLIKPILDIGAAGVIVPNVKTVEEATRAAAACRYPPEGIRGFGPRRPSNYGRKSGPQFCKDANARVVTIIQIEHIDAMKCLGEMLAVPGITAATIGPQDLACSMGHSGEPSHPAVLQVIDDIIREVRKTDVFMGYCPGCCDTPGNRTMRDWIDKGVQWLQLGDDYSLMAQTAEGLTHLLRGHWEAKSGELVSAGQNRK
jgi:2-dehydro-3-deoxyglucarate aldolase/4-hydroxy-2-oxoheptanedioate aldolase